MHKYHVRPAQIGIVMVLQKQEGAEVYLCFRYAAGFLNMQGDCACILKNDLSNTVEISPRLTYDLPLFVSVFSAWPIATLLWELTLLDLCW